ncbi:hypothetical protein XH87_09055 [Bradyrhizobium sp. CCBAU 53415]|nr:hypothetical protein [Bradyrhizobium sp. CCBAU 53415]
MQASGIVRPFLWQIECPDLLLPVVLKVPMVAMVVLLDLCFPSPHLAASMMIDRPEAIDGAPRMGSTAKE